MKTKGIIFDLDNTLIDSSSTDRLRELKNWSKVYQSIRNYQVDPLIVKMINRLKEREVKVCVVSNSPVKYCEDVLNHMGVTVDYIVGYHDVIDYKPAPEPIYLAMALMKHPDVVIGVGDDIIDIEAYNRAGIDAIKVSYYSRDNSGCITIKELLNAINELLFVE